MSEDFILNDGSVVVYKYLLYGHRGHLEGQESSQMGKGGRLTSARRILLKALAMEASIPIISNSMSSSPKDTSSTRKPCK